MLHEPPSPPNHILEAILRTISRPNINFARSEPPVPHAATTTGSPVFCPHGHGQRGIHITDLANQVREVTPLLTPTPTTSINWWPYPPWGQPTVSSTPPDTATLIPLLLPSSVIPASAVTSSNSLTSTTPLPEMTSSVVSTTPQAAVTSITALPSTSSLSSNPGVHTATNSHFNVLYLVPVFIAVGLALGALSGLLWYRWYSRRLGRKGGFSNSIRVRERGGSSFLPGPPYAPMLNASPISDGAQEASPTTANSPSKNTHHGASRAARSWLSAVARASSRRSSTRNSSISHSIGSTP